MIRIRDAMIRLLGALGVAAALAACSPPDDVPAAAPTDTTAAACAEAERLSGRSPWPPPDSGRLEEAIVSSAVDELLLALEVALDATTDHERIVGVDHRGVAPSEAQAILSVCAGLVG